jgi:hypothetical protein
MKSKKTTNENSFFKEENRKNERESWNKDEIFEVGISLEIGLND